MMMMMVVGRSFCSAFVRCVRAYVKCKSVGNEVCRNRIVLVITAVHFAEVRQSRVSK